MIIDNTLLFEKKHYIIINNTEDNLFYYFDYDDRDTATHMKFQHFHPYYEIMIFLAPEGDHLFEGNLSHLSFGDIVLIPPYLLHQSIYRKGAPSNRIIIDFLYPDSLLKEHSGYPELLSVFNYKQHVFRFLPEQRLRLYQKLNEITKYSLLPEYADRPVDHLMIHTLFTNFLHELYRMRDQNQYRNDAGLSLTTQKMHSVASYIHQHYEEPLTLQMLADMFFLNPSYLSHSFKDTMHFTLSDYIQNIRIKNAQHKLMTTNDKVSNIAISCGFNNLSHFHRVFSKVTGMSPLEYRKLPLNSADQR